MRQRILVLGADNAVGARTVAALQASDWAEPISFGKPARALSAEDLGAVDGVANCTIGSGEAVRAGAAALFSAAARLAHAVRIVHLSSMTIYGSREGEVTESIPALGDLGAYANAHIEAERCASRYANSVILRCGCEYGPGCGPWSERIAQLLIRRRIGDLGAAGDGVCNLLYIDDLVDAILAALAHAQVAGHAFNLAMSRPPTWNQYFVDFGIALGAVPVRRVTARRIKFETRVLALPLKFLEIAARRSSARGVFAQPPITPSLINLCRQEITLNVSKAEEHLGSTWTPLAEGLRQAAIAFHAAGAQPR